MSLTYGFFDSRNHDRMYRADEMNTLFDGILKDGVFDSIGETFNVTATGNGMLILVHSGRAFFNNTWTYNDSSYPVLVPNSDTQLSRIDTVVLEINKNNNIRKNYIKIVQGQGALEDPTRATLIHEGGIDQYALALINVPANKDLIEEEDITLMVGSDETPFAVSEVDQMPIENLYSQFEGDFQNYFNDWKNDKDEEFDTWLAGIVNEMSSTQIGNLQASILAKETKPVILTKTLTRGDTSFDPPFQDDSINDNSFISIFTDPYGVRVESMRQYGHILDVTFGAMDQDVVVKVLVRNQ